MLHYTDHKTDKTRTFEEILALEESEKSRLGLIFTPREIAQQPATWPETFKTVKDSQNELQKFLDESGLTQNGNSELIVTLIGAGTSDYIGRAIAALVRKKWRCHVQVVASTDLMMGMDCLVESAPDNSRHLWISFSRSGDGELIIVDGGEINRPGFGLDRRRLAYLFAYSSGRRSDPHANFCGRRRNKGSRQPKRIRSETRNGCEFRDSHRNA